MRDCFGRSTGQFKLKGFFDKPLPSPTIKEDQVEVTSKELSTTEQGCTKGGTVWANLSGAEAKENGEAEKSTKEVQKPFAHKMALRSAAKPESEGKESGEVASETVHEDESQSSNDKEDGSDLKEKESSDWGSEDSNWEPSDDSRSDMTNDEDSIKDFICSDSHVSHEKEGSGSEEDSFHSTAE